MNPDLENEIEAINSIYGDSSLTLTENDDIYVLNLPQQSTSLRIQFPTSYPALPPTVLGTHSSGEHTRKGDAAHILDIFRDALGRLFQPGEVCLFDIIEDVTTTLESPTPPTDIHSPEPAENPTTSSNFISTHDLLPQETEETEEPPWTLSNPHTELKSTFLARCAPISTPAQAQSYLAHLLATDKKARSATHNITAWRIRGENGVVYQDCDDDGETAAGGRVLHLLQLMDVWGLMVVVTRWYGGQKLGAKRFSVINSVAREAVIAAGFGGEEKKGKGKR